MKTTDLTLFCLTCILVLSFSTVLCENPTNTTNIANTTDPSFLPSEHSRLNCTGLDNCTDSNCTYNQKNSTVQTMKFFPDNKALVDCGKFEVTTLYHESVDKDFVVLGNGTCITYGNGYKNFTVVELNLNKPKGSNASNTLVTCTDPDNKNCILFKQDDNQFTFVAGMPSYCSVYFEPPTTTVPSTTTVTTSPPNATSPTDPKSTNTTIPVPSSSDTTTKPSDGGEGKKAPDGGDGKKADGSGTGGAGQIKLSIAAALTALFVTLLSRF